MKSRHVGVVLLVALLAVVLLPLTAQAQKLTKFNSRFYEVHTNLTRDEVRPVADHMDKVYASFKQRFASVFKNRRAPHPKLYLFATRQDYINVLGQIGIPAQNSGGMYFYRGSESGLATFVKDNHPQYLLKTLQHEGFHQFAHNYIGHTLPLWANEGLAEYFGDALMIRGKLKLGIVEQRRLNRVRHAIENNAEFHVSELIHITSNQWFANMGGPRGHLQYAQSWSMAYFLIHGDPRYRKAFQNYLDILASGRLHAQAWQQAFGGASEQLMHEKWKAYVMQLEPDPFSTTITHMNFIAHALKTLYTEGAAIPETMDELEALLIEREYSMQLPMAHGGGRASITAEPEVFRYIARSGKEMPLVLQVAQEDAAVALPVVVAPQLNPRARVVWKLEGSGQISHTIEYR